IQRIMQADGTADSGTDSHAHAKTEPVDAGGFPPAFTGDNVGHISGRSGRFEARGKAMDEPQEKETSDTAQHRIEEPADEAHNRSHGHHRHAAHRIRELSTERPGYTRRE